MAESHESPQGAGPMSVVRGHLLTIVRMYDGAPTPPKGPAGDMPIERESYVVGHGLYFETLAQVSVMVRRALDELAEHYGSDDRADLEHEYYVGAALASAIGALALNVASPGCVIPGGMPTSPEEYRASQYDAYNDIGFLCMMIRQRYEKEADT